MKKHEYEKIRKELPNLQLPEYGELSLVYRKVVKHRTRDQLIAKRARFIFNATPEQIREAHKKDIK